MGLDPGTLRHGTYCLHAISKSVTGEARIIDRDQKSCLNLACEPLTVVQRLRLSLVSSKPCDSPLGATLDGDMSVGNLTTVFIGPNQHLRGVHAANFSWTPSAGGSIASGTLEGITNAGIVRVAQPPVNSECERCDRDGVLTGHLFATGTSVPGIPVPDFYVDAIYRLEWDPMHDVGTTVPVIGTVEGVMILPCPP